MQLDALLQSERNASLNMSMQSSSEFEYEIVRLKTEIQTKNA